MDRTNTVNGTWFDADEAEVIEGLTEYNGSNYISIHVGANRAQNIYITKSGAYVLQHTSRYSKEPTWYEELDKEEAMEWLLTNKNYDKIDKKYLQEKQI